MGAFAHKSAPLACRAPSKTSIPERARFGRTREPDRRQEDKWETAVARGMGVVDPAGADFSRMPVWARKTRIQPKLMVNQPDDPYEREADRVAEKVTGMEVSSPQVGPITAQAPQAGCTSCDEEKGRLQRKEGQGANYELDHFIDNLSSSGQELPADVRGYYGPRFGFDFSQVRVHTDATAARSARAVHALAYTTGNHIVFNSGQFAPFTDPGSKLLAHELTHVVQQSSGHLSKAVQRQDPGGDDPFHRDPFYVQPGGPFDVGDNICTFKLGLDGSWEVCCPVPGAAQGSDNACFSNESLDRVKEWARRHGGRPLPDVHCPPGRTPNPMMGSCCPPGQVPQGLLCVDPGAGLPTPACPSRQRTLSGTCCPPPQVALGDICINLQPPPTTVPTPAPTATGLAIHFTLGVLDDYNINESNLNNRQQPAWLDIRRQAHQFMQACPRSFMTVTGYTDAPGDDQFNLDLGQRRADHVKMELQLSLLDIPAALPVQIFSRSEGENNPVDTAAGSNYSARNRRVEIEFYSVCPPLQSPFSLPTAGRPSLLGGRSLGQ